MKKKVLLLLGHGKCGSRWLSQVLLETQLFYHMTRMKVYAKGLKPEEINISLLEKMNKSGKNLFFMDLLIMEDERAIKKLVKLLSDYEIIPIVIYRDLIEVLTSYYYYNRNSKNYGDIFLDNKDFIVKDYKASFEKSFLPGGLLYKIYKILYDYPKNAKVLRKYFKTYIELDYYDIKNNRYNTLKKILSIIGINKAIKFDKLNTIINKTYIPRSILAEKIIWKIVKILVGLESTTLNNKYRSNALEPSLLNFALKINEKKSIQKLSKSQIDKLKKIYKEDVEQLRKITGLKLKSWVY
ncbi:MAG: hypothetical protein CMJ06_03960 [Pelagibacterales bacterium]|nr:hypothetical protein [Pelagibacterales bacterium]OUU62166.1 MAG: hypothetical protein CBC22_05410 [Alphaproteobacteria bacterium TMED62]|tara:strand:+ start:1806 stop:2696 length:891 start_codon:yes stop_codon:yes gene_type:complete